MKKVLLFCMLLFCGAAHAGPVANVEYVHKVIEQQWGIEIPYNPELKNPQVAANMKYLLTAVDVANKILNREATTDYGNGAYATMSAADTVATLDASDRLIKVEPKFFITTTPDTTTFNFKMSASGTFQIDWGDGTLERIVRLDTEDATYSHTYSVADEYRIGIGGRVTGYNSDIQTSAIQFVGNKNTAKIEGSLGQVFSTIDNGDGTVSQPSFENTFFNNSNLKSSIPVTLFDGIYGAPIYAMFRDMFSNSGITGEIPAGLFGNIEGAPVGALFSSTFQNCSGLTGEIPGALFAKIRGRTAYATFLWTFSGCSGLSGSIPANLFSGITGRQGSSAFWGTFSSCTGLTGQIPANLFSGITGAPAGALFRETFFNCSGLTGEIPEDLFAGLDGAPTTGLFHQTFAGCTGLTGQIPEKLFAGIKGVPAESMFSYTFSECHGLTGRIPDKLFAGIDTTAPAAWGMFAATFRSCPGLTGPSARINGVPMYQIWPDATYDDVGACYLNMTQLDDWADIPIEWKKYPPEE